MASMAWKLHAIEQTQLRRQHRVGGVLQFCNLITTQVPTCLWVTIAAALNWSIYFRLGGTTPSD